MGSDGDLKHSSQGTDLEYTGERHMTDQVGLALSLGHIDHMVRYAFAASFVGGKRVLDITCGSGYGSQFMALQGASEVVGVDIDKSAIEYARKLHQHQLVSYLQADAHSVPQLEDASFDVIVSFETIEHLERPRDFLLELRRLLKPGGQLFLSCPNDYRVSPWISEFHIHKFKFTEFRDLIVNVFGKATFIGQHNTVASSLLKPVPISETTSHFEAYRKPLPPEFFGGQYLDYISSLENSNGYFAIVGVEPSLISNQTSISQNAFQEVMESFYFATEETRRARQEVDFLKRELIELRQQTQTELERWQTQLQKTQADYQTEIERWQSQLQKTQAQLEQSQSHQQQTQAQLERSQSTIKAMETTIKAIESSKFWKLRMQWFKLKKLVGFKENV